MNVIDAAATKPFSFLPHYPGIGVGGHCIPVDPYYLIDKAKEYDFEHSFLALARQINSSMPAYAIQLIRDGLAEIKLPLHSAHIAILGLGYKANIDDDRESPSHDLIQQLQKVTQNFVIYDPFIPHKSTVDSLVTALDWADVIVVATAHDMFKAISVAELKKYNIRLLIDGRNNFNKQSVLQAGIHYKGIGV